MKTRELLLLSAAVIAGLLVRFLIASSPGFVSDLGGHKTWSWFLVHQGFESMYLPDGGVKFVDYPPFYLYVLDLIGRLYETLHPEGFPTPEAMPTYFLKISPIIVEVLTAFLIYVIVRKKASFTAAYLSMLAYLFNPALIYNTAYWGQVDAWGAALALASLFALAENWVTLPVFLITSAILMKVMYVIYLPLVFYVVFRRDGLRKTAYAFLVLACSAFLILLPVVYSGQLEFMFDKVIHSSDQYSHVTVNAYNIWRLTYSEDVEYYFQAAPSDENHLYPAGFLSPKSIGLAAYVLMIVLFFRFRVKDDLSRDSILYAGFILSYGLFMLTTRMHERYLFPAFAFLCALIHRDRRLQAVYLLLSLVFLVNLAHVLTTYYPDAAGKKFFDSIAGEVKATALFNTILFAYTLGLSYNRQGVFKDDRRLRLILCAGTIIMTLFLLRSLIIYLLLSCTR